MARRGRKRAESRARYYIRTESAKRGWDPRHLAAGGDCLEENEIVSHFSQIGLGLDKPDFLYCLGGEPEVVVEAKNEAGKLDQAIEEAIGYADAINRHARHGIRIAVGVAGEDDAGVAVDTRFLSNEGWEPLVSHRQALTAFPSKREVELALTADDGTTTVSIPASEEFVDAAVELSRLLRAAKVEAPLRPKVIGAIVAAMYQGPIDTDPQHALTSVNTLAERAIENAGDTAPEVKDLLIGTLALTAADFDRLAPWIRRIVSILRRLNVRSVLQTDTDFLGMFYEAFLRYGYDNNALGIVFTPRHITRFCVDLVGVAPNDRVIDVASGTGGFLVGAFDRMTGASRSDAAVDKVKASIFGYETNPTVWALSMLNMFFRGDGKSHMSLGSCLTESSRASVAGRFTRAFLNPPFSQDNEPERDFIDAALGALEPEGIMAAVVHAGIFADNEHRAWREQVLRRHALLAMVSLPEDLFYPTAAPTSIVVMRAHVPQTDVDRVLMSRVWNDGYRKSKNRRVEQSG